MMMMMAAMVLGLFTHNVATWSIRGHFRQQFSTEILSEWPSLFQDLTFHISSPHDWIICKVNYKWNLPNREKQKKGNLFPFTKKTTVTYALCHPPPPRLGDAAWSPSLYDQVVALGDVPEFEQLSAELPDGHSDLSSSFFCKRFFSRTTISPGNEWTCSRKLVGNLKNATNLRQMTENLITLVWNQKYVHRLVCNVIFSCPDFLKTVKNLQTLLQLQAGSGRLTCHFRVDSFFGPRRKWSFHWNCNTMGFSYDECVGGRWCRVTSPICLRCGGRKGRMIYADNLRRGDKYLIFTESSFDVQTCSWNYPCVG